MSRIGTAFPVGPSGATGAQWHTQGRSPAWCAYWGTPYPKMGGWEPVLTVLGAAPERSGKAMMGKDGWRLGVISQFYDYFETHA